MIYRMCIPKDLKGTWTIVVAGATLVQRIEAKQGIVHGCSRDTIN
jgi:hypothetical protein